MKGRVATLISALLTSSVLILVILLLRKMLRGKVGNGFLYALWLVVAVRLLMPAPEFLLEKVAGIEKPWIGSSVSVMNLAAGLASYWENDRTGQPEELPKYSGEEEESISAREPEGLSGEKTGDSLLEKSEAEKGTVWQAEKEAKEQNTGMSQTNATSGKKPEIQEVEICNKKFGGGGGWQFIKFSTSPLANIAGYVWLFGSLLLLCVQVISERRFRRRLTECREEITVCGQKAYKVRGISTPLLFRSRGFTLDIYIPEEIMEDEKLVSHAVLHENVHKKHGDIWWGYLRNLLVAAYWFHPLVWVAALCSKRDCEYACDSSVTGQMDQEERISYGNSLLSLVQLGREGNLFHAATLMSIKKSELKKRIYLVKRGKRNGIAATIVTVLVIAAVSVSTFTGVKAEANPERESQLQGEVSKTGVQQQEAKEDPMETAISAGTKEAVGAGTEEPAEQTVPALEKESSELTMEKLLDSYHNEELSKWTIKKILKYENISEIPQSEDFEEIRAFQGKLVYQGIDYRLHLNYYEEKFRSASIENKETGEDNYFYVAGENVYGDLLVSLDVFLHHDRILDEEISYILPEKLLETKDSYNVNHGRIGRLFCRDEKEKYGLYSGYTGGLLHFWWNSTGGLMKSYNLVYNKEDKMVDLFKNEHTNNSTREFSGGKLQRIDGCENVTSLQGLVFNPDAEWEFGAPNWYSQKEAGDLTKKEAVEALSGRKFWVICVLDEKNIEEWQSLGYIFFFDAERYTKKQMIALAKSVHLK